MRAAALAAVAAPAPAFCRADSSDQDQVARAFVAAAIRLAPTLSPDQRGPLQPSLGRRRCQGGVTGCIGDLPRPVRP